MIRKIIIAAAALCVLASNAEARPKHHIGDVTGMIGCSDPVQKPCYFGVDQLPILGRGNQRKANKNGRFLPDLPQKEITHQNTTRHDPRPRAWCGWQMRRWMGVANRAGNLARWWAGYGSRSHGPAVGALVVWHHHVGIITGKTAQGWVVKSGNDGNAVRERVRSVSNAIAFRWP